MMRQQQSWARSKWRACCAACPGATHCVQPVYCGWLTPSSGVPVSCPFSSWGAGCPAEWSCSSAWQGLHTPAPSTWHGLWPSAPACAHHNVLLLVDCAMQRRGAEGAGGLPGAGGGAGRRRAARARGKVAEPFGNVGRLACPGPGWRCCSIRCGLCPRSAEQRWRAAAGLEERGSFCKPMECGFFWFFCS